MSGIRARAKIIVTLEIDATSVWGEDCSIGQVVDQAKRETIEKLRRESSKWTYIKMIGEPKVTAVLASEQ